MITAAVAPSPLPASSWSPLKWAKWGPGRRVLFGVLILYLKPVSSKFRFTPPPHSSLLEWWVRCCRSDLLRLFFFFFLLSTLLFCQLTELIWVFLFNHCPLAFPFSPFPQMLIYSVAVEKDKLAVTVKTSKPNLLPLETNVSVLLFSSVNHWRSHINDEYKITKMKKKSA